MTFCNWKYIVVLGLVAMLGSPCFAQKPGKGSGGGSSGGGETTGPQFAVEVLSFSGFVRDFNDQGDVLGEIYDSNNDSYTYYLGTVDSGARVFEEIRMPAGWQIRLWAMNNARQLVGQGMFDPAGDGLDVNGDNVLDEGDILSAGVVITPDANNDGIWEMTIVFPGPLEAACEEINNDGDIVGYDESLGRVLLRAEGTSEPFPFRPYSLQVGNPFSDRDVNGDVSAVLTGTYYLPRKYQTATGLVTILPTFDNAYYVTAYAFAINSSGAAVGRADDFPAVWSPQGTVSKIPGWSKGKSATGSAYCINELGEISVTSASQGCFLYSPVDGLIPLSNAIANPGAIPSGYQLSQVFYVNNNTQLTGTLKNSAGDLINVVLHPVE